MANALVPCSALRLVAQPLSVPSRKWVLWDGDDAASSACILLCLPLSFYLSSSGGLPYLVTMLTSLFCVDVL